MCPPHHSLLERPYRDPYRPYSQMKNVYHTTPTAYSPSHSGTITSKAVLGGFYRSFNQNESSRRHRAGSPDQLANLPEHGILHLDREWPFTLIRSQFCPVPQNKHGRDSGKLKERSETATFTVKARIALCQKMYCIVVSFQMSLPRDCSYCSDVSGVVC